MSELKSICICVNNFKEKSDEFFVKSIQPQKFEIKIGEKFTYYYSNTNNKISIYRSKNQFMMQIERELFDKYFEDIITNRNNKLNKLWDGNQQLT